MTPHLVSREPKFERRRMRFGRVWTRQVNALLRVAFAAAVGLSSVGCGGFPIPGVTEMQAGDSEPTESTVTPPQTGVEASVAPPTTVAAALATVPPTAARTAPATTNPATRPLPSTPAKRSLATSPPTAAPQRVSDWFNHTYRTSCEEIEADSLRFVNGKSSPDDVTHFGWATIIDVFDAGNDQTVVLIHCDVSSAVNYSRVLLMNGDGSTVDDIEVWGDSIGDLTFREEVQEGWEEGIGPGSAASVRDVTFSVANRRLVKGTGDTTPKCAYVGFIADPDPSLSNGYVVNREGELVRRAQQRLIALGYGGPIEATGGADGYAGMGTILAIELFHGNIQSEAVWRAILDGTSEEPYDPFAVVLDVDEVRNTGVDCVGEYKW